jgi:hypothetical protein
MWIATDRGFYSVVSNHDDPSLLTVRARVRDDLLALNFPVAITATPERDYPYRVVVSREQWKHVLATMIDEQDYGNFKHAVETRQGTDRHDIYLGVWGALAALDDCDARGFHGAT